MTEPLPSQKPNFFGKDRFVSFIGQVEDVNDPKHSNRVKVRCIGWHPNKKKGENSLSTDDLPWARVGMPPTHAQQGRIGGKHGLLPGSWVFGFFLDGEDAQDPMVLSSFDFTAKASDKDNRTEQKGRDGKVSEEDRALDKTTIAPKVGKNSNTSTVSEKQIKGTSSPGDPAGDTVATNAIDPCTGTASNKSLAATLREEEELGKTGDGKEESQNYGVSIADGLCGSSAHAADDIQRKIKERIPPAVSRFVYGDVVWNSFSGNFIDMNGMLLQLAKELCSLLKQPAQALKAITEEINRIKKAVGLQVPDRDGVATQASDTATTTADDMFHGIFASTLIDILCQLIMQELQNINNDQNESSLSDNNQGYGTNPNTSLTNTEARCITDRLLDNVNTLTNNAIDEALRQSEEASNGGSNSGSAESYIMSILGSLQGVMRFALTQKYSVFAGIFNKSGPMSQDILTKAMGCINERQYLTFAGALSAGGGGSGSGSGNGDGSSGYGSFTDNLPNVGFGGYPGSGTGEISYELCEEATDPDFCSGSALDNCGSPTNPGGGGGQVVPLPLPSDNEVCAQNYIQGIPNTIIITNTGKDYFFANPTTEKNSFPSIFIRNYKGRPLPVVDRDTGELVAILTTCKDWPDIPAPPVTIIPDDNPNGITTDDPNFEIVLGGLVVANTGFQYCNPKIEIFDKDKKKANGEATLTIIDGRIVEAEILNKGSGFKRLPEIRITDDGSSCGTNGGFGSVIYPIMEVIPKEDSELGSVVSALEVVYCPSKNLKNLY
jgi:hypothetical protein